MKHLIICIAITLAGIASADTLQQRVDALDAAPNVLEAWIDVTPVSIGRAGTVYAGRVAWVESTGSTATQRGIEVIVVNLGVVGQEAAYWLNDVPGPLKTETKYFTSRTVGGWGALTAAAQLSAIKSNINSVYATLVPGSANIREFSAQPVDGTTIKVSGYFDIGTTWEYQTWYARLVDLNIDIPVAASYEFQRVVETAAP